MGRPASPERDRNWFVWIFHESAFYRLAIRRSLTSRLKVLFWPHRRTDLSITALRRVIVEGVRVVDVLRLNVLYKNAKKDRESTITGLDYSP